MFPEKRFVEEIQRKREKKRKKTVNKIERGGKGRIVYSVSRCVILLSAYCV